MHKKILRILTLALAILLLVSIMPQEISANDMQIKEIRDQITSTYKAAKKWSGRPSFSGYCASLVNWQLYLLGITEEKLSNNGNQEYDYFAKQTHTSGGYSVRAYSDNRYSLEEALNYVSENGTKNVYNMIVCFQSTNSAAGRRYGHAFLVHAILDGIVYYSESSSVSVNGKYYPEGSAIAVPIREFCAYYGRWADYEGLIYFGRKTYADECDFFSSNLYVSVTEDTALYSSPCTSATDVRSKFRCALRAGEKLHVVGLYRNTEGECWYEVDDGYSGYIPADKTTLICTDYSDVQANNMVSPYNLRYGTRFAMKGQISADHTRLYTIRAQVYALEDGQMDQIYSSTVMVDSNDYTLNGSSLSNSMAFRKLPKGTYLYMVAAVVGNYYVQDGEVKLEWKTLPLWTSRFNVVSSRGGVSSVVFHANGGHTELNQAEVKTGTVVGSLPVPQRDGYQFLGWYTQQEGGVAVDSNFVVSENTVLYAHWAVDENADGWYPVDGTWYYLSDGKPHEGFVEDDGLVYYTDANGVPVSGWQSADGKRYYFSETGIMQTGLQTINGIRYLLGEDGAAMSGWAEANGNTYYLNPDGSLLTGWAEIDGELYFFDSFSGSLILSQSRPITSSGFTSFVDSAVDALFDRTTVDTH